MNYRTDPSLPPAAEEGASPADIARGQALEELAGIPFEDQPVGLAADISTFQPGTAPAAESKSALSRPQIDALIAQAIDYAVDNGAEIINMSLGVNLLL